MSEIRVERIGDVDDGVRDDELEEPAKGATHGGGEHDGARRGDVRIRAFLREVEGGVVTGHGPDDGDEAHEHADAGGEVDAFVDGAPDGGAVGEAGEAALWAVGAGGDEDEDDGEGEDVEGGADGVDGGERFSREGRHGAVDEHDERC